MPHKHTRREKDPSTLVAPTRNIPGCLSKGWRRIANLTPPEYSFDLPPSQIAKPLPAKPQKQDGHRGEAQGNNLKRKRNNAQQNDTPRAFKRLMAYADGKKPRSGLDDGVIPSAKSKKNNKKAATAEAAAPEKETKETKETKKKHAIPKIKHGESMSEFASRVDAALPVGGLINKSAKNGKDPLGLKVWRTKKERKMHKLYDEWREEERKIKEQREEELELQAEKELEDEEAGVSWKLNMEGATTGKKKGKRARYLGEVGGVEEDPWEVLKKKRGESRPGLHDVAKAPPELNLKVSKKLTVRGAAVAVDGIPKSAGSLRRREELQEVRDDVVAQYRRLMEGKRPGLRQP